MQYRGGMSFSRIIATAAALLTVALPGCSAQTDVTPQHSAVPAISQEAANPTPAASPAPTEAEIRVDQMTLNEQIRTLLLLHSPGTDGSRLKRFVSRTGASGIILMGDNIPGSSSQTRTMVNRITTDPPPLIAIDQEGGPVVRLRGDTLPSMRQLASQPITQTAKAFEARAQLVQRAGATVNFGIVADVARSPSSYMWPRSAGPSVTTVGDRVAAAVASENGHVYSTLKHFPGHGVANGDSHNSLPTSSISRQYWSTTHAVPFARGIDAGADLVMMGHLRLTSVSSEPATLSPRWVHILRHDMGFRGVIVTDDLLMLSRSGIDRYADPVANAVSAVDAGNDLVLLVLPDDPSRMGFSVAQFVDGVSQAVRDGRIPREQIRESAVRIMTLRLGTP